MEDSIGNERLPLNSLISLPICKMVPLVNGLLVRVLEKAVSGFDFTKTQLTGTVLGFLKRIKKTDS